MAFYSKESTNFDPNNLDSWKNNMRKHMVCLGIDYWMITKKEEQIKPEDELDSATDEEKNMFSCNMVSREALISVLSKGEFSKVKDLDSTQKI